jgi:hypothetical protein
VVHTFFDCDPTSGAEGHFKGTPRKGRSELAQIRTVAMGKSDIDELCSAISDCFESIDDLILKLWFRRRFLSGNPSAPDHAYLQAVHGWQDLPFDLARLTIYPMKRARRAKALRAGRPNGRRPEGCLPRDCGALALPPESAAASVGDRRFGGAGLSSLLAGEEGSEG